MLRSEQQRGGRASTLSVDRRLPPARATRSSGQRVPFSSHLLLRVAAAAVLLIVILLPLAVYVPSPFTLRWTRASSAVYADTAAAVEHSRGRGDAAREDDAAAAAAASVIPRLPPPDPSDADSVGWLRSHVLFFLHVPKTGGQSFSSTLRALLRPYQQLHRAVGALSPPRLDVSFMQRSAVLRLLTAPDAADFRDMYGPHVLLLGHADTRIAEAIAARDGRHVLFLSMMREPVQRLLSHFCYVSRILAASMQAQQLDDLVQHLGVYTSWLRRQVNATRDAGSALSFSSFLTLAAEDGLDNWATRAAAGCLPSVLPTAEAQLLPTVCSDPQLMLAEAKRRMASFLFIGLTERYSASLRLLRHSLHYEPQLYFYSQQAAADDGSREENVNDDKQRCLSRLTAEGLSLARLQTRIEEAEALDVQLYAFAAALFASRIAGLMQTVE